MSNDPLLQPYKLKHLTLRNRIMITSHEPAYSEDGMPKRRYRLYHAEKAKGGMALTMTAGSASVSRDSPPVFNNILAWKDEERQEFLDRQSDLSEVERRRRQVTDQSGADDAVVNVIQEIVHEIANSVRPS